MRVCCFKVPTISLEFSTSLQEDSFLKFPLTTPALPFSSHGGQTGIHFLPALANQKWPYDHPSPNGSPPAAKRPRPACAVSRRKLVLLRGSAHFFPHFPPSAASRAKPTDTASPTASTAKTVLIPTLGQRHQAPYRQLRPPTSTTLVRIPSSSIRTFRGSFRRRRRRRRSSSIPSLLSLPPALWFLPVVLAITPVYGGTGRPLVVDLPRG